LAINIEGGNDVSVDLSDLEESSDIAANTALITTNTTNISSNDTDIANNTAAITAEVTRATAAETTIQADVDANETDADNAIALVQTNLDTHITADQDTSATNELSDLNLDATSNMLTLTNAEAGATGVDLSGYVSSDDQNLESATLSATSELAINIEGGNDVTVDLSDLEESSDIAANTALITTNTTNISSNDTDIANNTAAITAEVTRATAAETAIQADVDANETDADNAIALVQTNLDTHITADQDTSATNELSDLNLDATSNMLTLTNAQAGATGVDLSGYVSTDDQEVELFAFNGSTFELLLKVEDDPTTRIANLSSLHADGTETKIVAGNSGITITGDGSSSLPYGIYNNFTEVDGSTTNEINTAFTTVNVAGTDYLRITDSNGDLDVPLSDLSPTGTTGSIFFADTDGSITENNGQLFWNNTNNRLGVGTSSPANKFHVTGAIRSEGYLNSDGSVGEPAYRFHDDTNTGMYSPFQDEISFTVGGVEALNIDEASSSTKVIIKETLELEGAVLDENDSAGTAGQVLTATATGTEWVTNYNPVKAIGKISSGGGIIKATTGVTTSRISKGRYQVTFASGIVSDADYIIQLTQPGRGGTGNDDPGISYSNQTATGFQVIIGDNDNGGSDRNRFDSEFMFTILDL
uniref:hypothetical protein n=1 Tax=uncultured Maribacter sp. TaxID=431308 RepID=UPI00262AAC4D